MKRFLLFILLLFCLLDLSAQFINYKNDDWKIRTLLDTTDQKKLKNLKENTPIIKQTLDSLQFILVGPTSVEEANRNYDIIAILKVIYQNLSIQQGLLEQKIKSGTQLQKDLSKLDSLEHKGRKYRRARRQTTIKENIHLYRKLTGELKHKERRLRQELFDIIVHRTISKKTELSQLVPYFSIGLTSIGATKVKPKLDSLNTAIYSLNNIIRKKQQSVEELTNHRERLKDSISTEVNKYKTSVSKLKTQKDSLLVDLREQNVEVAWRYDSLHVMKLRLEQENLRIQSIKNQMKTMQELHDQASESLEKKRLALQGKLNVLQKKINQLQTDSVNLTIANKKLEGIKDELKQTNNKQYDLIVALLVILLLSVVVAWSSSYQKRRELTRTSFLLQQQREQLEVINQQLRDRTEALELSHKELQHRVKNNLQKVNSLIFRRLFSIEDPYAKATLAMLQDELGAIALIHQKLYAGDNQKLTLINIADYAEELVQSIVKEAATTSIHVEPIYIEMDNAVEIGLMLNELVTNAYKHGFPTIRIPSIKVEIFVKGHFIVLKVQDNGSGFPENFSITSITTFGLLAIADIVKRHQKEGSSLKVFNRNGANIEIQLPFDYQSGKLTA